MLFCSGTLLLHRGILVPVWYHSAHTSLVHVQLYNVMSLITGTLQPYLFHAFQFCETLNYSSSGTRQLHFVSETTYYADLEFSRLESWTPDISRLVFTSLGLGLGQSVLNLGVLVLVLEPQSLGLGLGLGTLQSRSRSWSWDLRQWRLGLHHS